MIQHPTRRKAIKAVAGAAFVAPLLGQGAPLFFTADEFRMVDELTELIIPADSHSPGAQAAAVASYIDFRLAEPLEERSQELWRDGLKRIDSLAEEMFGQPFLKVPAQQRIALLERISMNESNPGKPEEHFFQELKRRTADAYYTSEIGIHGEMGYKGNTSLAEFVGYDAE